MDEHIARILKMVEEGKITAADAEKLLAALRPAAPASAGPPGAAASNAGAQNASGAAGASTGTGRDGGQRPQPPGQNPASEDRGQSKSFEFSWSHRRSFPFDLSGLGRQISEAVRKIDPEKLVREARGGFAKGGKRWQDRMKEWARFVGGEDGPPENTLGQPAARATENLVFSVTVDAAINVENRYGAIQILGGGDTVSIDIEKEAWAPTDEEANARLRELKVEALTQQTPALGASRLEVRVQAPDEFRDGWANLRLTVPTGVSVRLQTVFGEVRAEGTNGEVEIHAIGGEIRLEHLGGEVRAEGISGNLHVEHIAGPLRLATKSGDIHAEHLSQGGEVITVSGGVHVRAVEGSRLEAKSVSGDVEVDDGGALAPMDLTLESVSGDVSLRRCRANLAHLKTISGDVEADGLEASTLQGETVSGDVEVKLTAPFSGTLTTNTVSGDVKVAMPETSNFRFTLGTQSGDLECKLAAHDTVQSDTLYSGTVGAGAGTVTIQTRSGDVELDRNG